VSSGKSINRVPFEFVGLARAFRARVTLDDGIVTRTLPQLLKKILERRSRHHTKLREDVCKDFVRTWGETIPRRFCLGSSASFRKGRLQVQEIRVTSLKFQDDRWQSRSSEPGLGIIALDLDSDNQIPFQYRTIVILSLHAIGRWYERAAGQRTDQALVETLAPLVSSKNYDAALERVMAGSGHWRGDVRKLTGISLDEHETVLDVRTFVTEPVFGLDDGNDQVPEAAEDAA
jgi:hypothetical protein